ncbi:hypothetical protein SAMN05444166_7126 [Singulisphaera sp. GP187]|uniref:hypothetical protein n=1 Tax=Singulisphaera sp. GP187 TaxID=1882752 RepID=UPI00092923BE|nr:hypothetical protein [Singulisphaera sp. GP187]SIO62706.1 hypothetical protein SAMN05444166_7126 [Singulisphaera sp. GP187]
MSADRPTVSPDLVAVMIESTPDRVRRRLDRTPDAAASWNWQAGEATWSVETGGETVTLPHGHVLVVEQIACTCLLSPHCFHVLACLTRLEVALVESPRADEKEQVASDVSDALDVVEHLVEPAESQRQAARELGTSVTHLLRVGVASSGVVVQSSLLRAVHQCRAEGLHRLAALGLRVIAGTSEIRARAPAADPGQLAEDIADVLETSHHVLREKPIAGFWIGTARRKQRPVRPRKLHGLFAEPIVTRSGFAGAAVYFLGEDGRIYSASDVRPGESQQASDAYLGGIEIGPMIQSAKQLARGLYLGTDLTASEDGRLGRGKSIRIAEQGPSSWRTEAIAERFRRPLPDQWNAVYAQAAVPADAKSAGWDFVFLEGAILGAVGPELLFQPTAEAATIRLAIENESETLCFRENLRMLSHAPGLRLLVIGRVNLLEPRIVAPLAVANLADDSRADAEPRLELPESWGGRICLGFDELQRHFLRNARATAVVLNVQGLPLEEDPLGPLRRRWIATMLSGIASQRPTSSNMIAAETATLNRSGFATGAALLDALAHTPSGEGPTSSDTFMATAIYLRTCAHERARFRATLTS